MKRLHLSIAVEDVAAAVGFYEALFGAAPTVRKPDYAKWMLDDPRVNFAIEARGRMPGVDHVGIQAESAGELAELRARVDALAAPRHDAGPVTCCYARSDKTWVRDPAGVRWEIFHTTDQADEYGVDSDPVPLRAGTDVCCGA